MPQRLHPVLDLHLQMNYNTDKFEDIDGKEVHNSRGIMNLFASPEAAAARDLLNKGVDEDLGNKRNDDVSSSIDIPLIVHPSLKEEKEKARLKTTEEIINSYYRPDMKPKTPAASRWRRATLCASICHKLEEDLKKIKVPTLTKALRSPSPIRRSTTKPLRPCSTVVPKQLEKEQDLKQLSVPLTPKVPRSPSPSRRSATKPLRPRSAAIPKQLEKEQDLKQLSVPMTPKAPRSPSPNRRSTEKISRPGRTIVARQSVDQKVVKGKDTLDNSEVFTVSSSSDVTQEQNENCTTGAQQTDENDKSSLKVESLDTNKNVDNDGVEDHGPKDHEEVTSDESNRISDFDVELPMGYSI